MSVIFKVAYARGVQNALVNTGAIGKYANEEMADVAAEIAAEEMSEDVEPVEGPVAADETADVAAKLIELSQASSETAEAAAEQADVAAEAAAAVASMKAASSELVHASGGGALAPNTITSAAAITAEGSMEAAARPEGYAENRPSPQAPSAQQGIQQPHPGAMTTTDVTKGASAAAILRKLAEGDFDHTTGGAGPNAVEDAPSAEGKMEAAARPSGYAETGPAVSEPVAQQGEEQAHPGSPTGETLEGKVASAFDVLFNKTAEEVVPHLPYGLTQEQKVAAVRTMIGMTTPERAQYISRIKSAMESEDEMSEEERQGAKEVAEEVVEEKLDGEEAKEAAAILRRLGFGV
jgi:hypothetical protein